MSNSKDKFPFFSNGKLQVAGVLLVVLVAACLLWFNQAHSQQAMSAMTAQVRFQGEYRIEDGAWQAIVPGRHIPATKGDVTLRGNFHLYAPDGEYVGVLDEPILLAFFVNHINLTFFEGENPPYIIDNENQLYGVSACGVNWIAHTVSGGNTDPMEILVHNPHRYGNEDAIDEMLSGIAIWNNIEFERDILESGQNERNIGLLFVVVSLVLLGSALFSAMLHIPNNRIIWLLGATIFFAGTFWTYGSRGASFWSDDIAFNTTVLGFSMMFYMMFVSAIITCFLQQTKNVGYVTTVSLGVLNGVYFLIPILTDMRFYDTWFTWVITQSLANVILLTCLIAECVIGIKKTRWALLGLAIVLLAFSVDVIAAAAGYWEGGELSKFVFVVLLVGALVVVLRIIPEGINAAAKAKELELQRSRLEAEKNSVEAELKERRVSIMLSQIQPHFIYNTLGTIERMCLKDPQKAFELVRNFSLYLRGNFRELDSVTPIRFSEELKHVEHYVNIEKVRFPDMCIAYEVEATDFVIPALSVQPLVENAIKHGLMRLETGGTVVIRSYETPTHFCVEVTDDGVGFDPTLPMDEKKHVGIRNIRGRLQAMVNGELILESEINVGTKAVIMIPKEVTV